MRGCHGIGSAEPIAAGKTERRGQPHAEPRRAEEPQGQPLEPQETTTGGTDDGPTPRGAYRNGVQWCRHLADEPSGLPIHAMAPVS